MIELPEEIVEQIEKRLGKPDYTEDAPGQFSLNINIVAGGTPGDMYTEYSPGLFALNINFV